MKVNIHNALLCPFDVLKDLELSKDDMMSSDTTSERLLYFHAIQAARVSGTLPTNARPPSRIVLLYPAQILQLLSLSKFKGHPEVNIPTHKICYSVAASACPGGFLGPIISTANSSLTPNLSPPPRNPFSGVKHSAAIVAARCAI